MTLSGKSFARPKSPILGWKFPSKSILLALISLWTTFGSTSSWRNARPEAVPRQIKDLFGQSRSACFLFKPGEMFFFSHIRKPTSMWVPHFLKYSAKTSKFQLKVEIHKREFHLVWWLPSKQLARLLFSRYSYTNIRWAPSTQAPRSSTRFGCFIVDIKLISVKNSFVPCFDSAESALMATWVPSLRTPCKYKIYVSAEWTTKKQTHDLLCPLPKPQCIYVDTSISPPALQARKGKM